MEGLFANRSEKRDFVINELRRRSDQALGRTSTSNRSLAPPVDGLGLK